MNKQWLLLFIIGLSGFFGVIENRTMAATGGELSIEQKRVLANEKKLQRQKENAQKRELANEQKRKRQLENEEKRALANERKQKRQQENANKQKLAANLQKEIVCNAEPTPSGWITGSIGEVCARIATTTFYERTLLKIDGMQSGSNLNICSGDKTPPGWITVSTGKPCHRIGNILTYYARTIKKL